MSGLKFSFDASFCSLILQIVYESVYNDYDLDKANKILIDVGCPEELILPIILGNQGLVNDKDGNVENKSIEELPEIEKLFTRYIKPLTLSDIHKAAERLPDHHVLRAILYKRFSKDPSDFDACWIDRDGLIFGMYGETKDLLHIQLADAIYDLYLHDTLPNPDNHHVDRILDCNGFIRTHRDHVLYSGYYYDIPISEQQVNSLYELSWEWGNRLRIGEDYKVFSSNDIKNIDGLSWKKLFMV